MRLFLALTALFWAFGISAVAIAAAVIVRRARRARFEAQQEAGDQGADGDVITVHNGGVR